MRHGGPRPVDQLFTQVLIPSFADAEHLGFSTRGMLAWAQPKPCRQVSASGKCGSITNGGYKRRGVDYAHTRNARQTPSLLVTLRDGRKLIIISPNAAVQHRAFLQKFCQ